MNKDEALKMAIEALDAACYKIKKWTKGGKWIAGEEASVKCKEALEQPPPKVEPFDVWAGTKPMQEPETWLVDIDNYPIQMHEIASPNEKGAYPVYRHPAPSWQGLSDDEREIAILSKNKAGEMYLMCLDISRAIEAKLKEKNDKG